MKDRLGTSMTRWILTKKTLEKVVNPMKITYRDMIGEAERQLRNMETVYPMWIQQGKVKADTASARIEIQRAIVQVLKTRLQDSRQMHLFKENYGRTGPYQEDV